MTVFRARQAMGRAVQGIALVAQDGFSARYGQAVSALVNLATRDGADRWRGRVTYETDRPLGNGGDYGLDRAVVSVEGPLPAGIRLLTVLDEHTKEVHVLRPERQIGSADVMRLLKSSSMPASPVSPAEATKATSL